MFEIPSINMASEKSWRFLAEKIAEVIHLPANAWVLLPSYVDTEEFIGCLNKTIQGFPLENLPWQSTDNEKIPYETILAFGSYENGHNTVSQGDCLRLCAEAGIDTSIIVDLTNKDCSIQQEFSLFMREWAHRVRMLDAYTWPRFICLIKSPLRWEDIEDVCLKRIASWEMACYREFNDGWYQHTVQCSEKEKLWIRAVMPELAAFDDDLANQYIWEKVVDFNSLQCALQHIAGQRGWDEQNTEIQACMDHIPRSGTLNTGSEAYLPASLQPLWYEGMLGLVGGVGWDLHGVLLSNPGWQKALKYRVWRGQARVIFPLLEALRLSVEHHLIESIGNDEFNKTLVQIRQDADMEYGDLSNANTQPSLHELGSLAKAFDYNWWRLASRIHVEIRNSLAHGQIVNADALEKLVELMQAITRTN